MLQSRGSLVPFTWGNDYGVQYTQIGDVNLTHEFQRASYCEMYRRQTWVYVVVDRRAKAISRLPLKVYSRNDNDRTELWDHPYARLLRRPNPRMGGKKFWRILSVDKDIHGEWMFAVLDLGGEKALFPLNPLITQVVMSTEGTITYEVYGSRSKTVLSEEQVVHSRSYNPDYPLRGLSPLEPLRDTLENEHAARKATASFWKRGARPGTVLKHPKTLGDEAGRRLRMQFDEVASGSELTGSTVLLEEGMEVERWTLTAEEAQYIETRKLNREECCAVYHMPPPAVGILERATFNNVTELLRSVYRDAIAPELQDDEDVLHTQLRPRLGIEEDVYAEFLMDEVLRGDFEQRMEALKNADHMTVAEKRKLENLPFIPGTDKILVNSTYVPLELAGQTKPLQRMEHRHSLTTKARLAGTLAQAWRNMAERHSAVLVRKIERGRRKNEDFDAVSTVESLYDDVYHRSITGSFLAAPMAVLHDAYGRDDGDARVEELVAEITERIQDGLATAVDGSGDLLAEVRRVLADIGAEADVFADAELARLEEAA